MSDTRLIERWLPTADIGIESTRERTPMTPFPAPNRLHVWWARRPLVVSRAAVLASLRPADADREQFRHILGIHGDPVATRRRIDEARRQGERFEGQAYSYPRALSHVPGQRTCSGSGPCSGRRRGGPRGAQSNGRRRKHSVRGATTRYAGFRERPQSCLHVDHAGERGVAVCTRRGRGTRGAARPPSPRPS